MKPLTLLDIVSFISSLLDSRIKKVIFANQNQAFNHDVITVKRMGDIDKVCYSASCRKSGIEIPYVAKGSKFNGKLENNICRARSAVREIALSNSWDFFCTLTIDPNKLDRYDLKSYVSALSSFLNNYNRNGVKVVYLFIPELHKDGAIHIHGLLSGIPHKDLITNEYMYLDWVPYHKRFGFISLSPIKDPVRVAFYISKYITKDLASAVNECNAHMYYCSKGLKRASNIFMGSEGALLIEPDFEGDYYKVLYVNNTENDFHDFIYTDTVIYETI